MPNKKEKKQPKTTTSKVEKTVEEKVEAVEEVKAEAKVESKATAKKASKNNKKAKVKSNNKVAKSDKNKNSNKWFKEFKAELKKIVWPTKGQLLENTTVVLSMVILVALVIFLLDLGFKELNSLEVKGAQAIKNSISASSTEDANTVSESTNETSNEATVEATATENN